MKPISGTSVVISGFSPRLRETRKSLWLHIVPFVTTNDEPDHIHENRGAGLLLVEQALRWPKKKNPLTVESEMSGEYEQFSGGRKKPPDQWIPVQA
jgi:hypothetical protein